jgi:hypothetical protein
VVCRVARLKRHCSRLSRRVKPLCFPLLILPRSYRMYVLTKSNLIRPRDNTLQSPRSQLAASQGAQVTKRSRLPRRLGRRRSGPASTVQGIKRASYYKFLYLPTAPPQSPATRSRAPPRAPQKGPTRAQRKAPGHTPPIQLFNRPFRHTYARHQ